MREITRGIYGIDGLKMGRTYLIAERDGLTLIDTSSETASAGIVRAIESIGRTVNELRAIVATHYHFDHVGNVAMLRGQSAATFYAHVADVPYITAEERWPDDRTSLERAFGPRWPGQQAIAVDAPVNEGDVLPLARGLQVIHTPGHTPGSISLLAAAHGVLFCGDAMMNVAGLRVSPASACHDHEQAKASVARLAELEFEHLLPGHGPPVLSRASEKVRAYARRWG